MKKMEFVKNYFLTMLAIIAITGLTLGLAGCSDNSKKSTPFQIVFSAAYVNESAVTAYGSALQGRMPELVVDGKNPLFTSMMMGETNANAGSGAMVDPMMGMAGMMRMAAVVSTGEMDVFIADMENAGRNARSDMFMPLDKVFPGEDLSAYGERLLSFDILSNDSYDPQPTGEKTPVCGFSITGNPQIRRIFGDQEIGVFIISNTKNLELAKKVMRSLL